MTLLSQKLKENRDFRVLHGTWSRLDTEENQRKTIVNSWVRCLENNQIVINSGFPTVNCGKR